MNIFEYVKGMTKGFTRTSLLSEIAITRDTITNTVLPVYVDNMDFLRKNAKTLNSGIYKRTHKEIESELRKSMHLRGASAFELIEAGVRNSLDILAFIEGYFTKETADTMTANSLTISKATAMQLLGAISFSARYARGWLDMVLSAENNLVGGLSETAELTQLQVKYISENVTAFAVTLAAISKPTKDISAMLEAIPEIVVAESNPRAIGAALGSKADPFRFGFVQSKWNPFYLYGMMSTDHAAAKYKSDVAEANIVQMKIYRLKAKLEDKEDPKMEKVIDNYQAELDKLRGRIYKMEQSV